MLTTNSRPVPRPLRLVSSPTSTSYNAGTHGPHSAPLVSDRTLLPQQRRQSSISYNNGAMSPQSSTPGSRGVKHQARTPPAQDAVHISHSPIARGVEPETRPLAPRDEAITLAEKHADLLRFIAQKESRCLELRTQLAQHEADLLLLKRKWERIVSKGGPRVAPSDRSDVLDGIREGMQSGFGRVLAVLEPASNAATQTRISPKPVSPPVGTTTAECTPSSTSSNASTLIPKRRASVSSRVRSSLSGSASSTCSLFDDVGGLENQSSASSVLDSPVCPEVSSTRSVGSPQSARTFTRNSYTFTPMQAEPGNLLEDDPSGKQRRARPASVQVVNPQAIGLQSPVLDLPSSTTLGRQVSAWVPDLNRKWEELKSNETISKQSKRASVLLNDVLSVLVPPGPSPASRHSPSYTVLGSTFFEPATAASIGAGSGSTSRSGLTPWSLLDEDEDDSAGAAVVLQPEVKPTPAGTPAKTEDEEVWNW